MKPEIRSGSPAVAGGLPSQKSAKLSGLTDNQEMSGLGGFMALLSIQDAEFSSGIQGDESNTPGTAGGVVSSFMSRDEDFSIAGSMLPVAGSAPPADLMFLLSQCGSLLPMVQPDQAQAQLDHSVGGLSALAQTSPDCLSPGLTLPESETNIGGANVPSGLDSDLKPLGPNKNGLHISMASLGVAPTSLASAPRADLVADTTGHAESRSDKSKAEILKNLPDTGARSRVEDLRILKLAVSGQQSSGPSTLMTDLTVNPAGFSADPRQLERQLFKFSAPTRPSIEGVFGGHNAVFGEGVGPSMTGNNVEMSQPEVHVAEQVSYWISHDVQNADLRLKGFDDLPIDVHISMQGNDVQVDFWTDHAEIRDILRAAESHLKDMLARDGVVLSGVSVGTSRRDEQGQDGRQQPNSSRRQAVVSEDTTAAIGATRPVSKSGGAIDVFV